MIHFPVKVTEGFIGHYEESIVLISVLSRLFADGFVLVLPGGAAFQELVEGEEREERAAESGECAEVTAARMEPSAGPPTDFAMRHPCVKRWHRLQSAQEGNNTV
ncbi:unnamed protein product [Menidia menidia]|uniref:(Atlantic silverside) hypothetical protein n=1 Tax=Menidia menidia TaxID=238744 RepID=A0A8S4BZR8_9TELE|nr:unnamed protein product [Menidia menidia]